MKIIECKSDVQTDGRGAGLGRALGNLNLPFNRQSQEVEDAFIQALQKRLDQRYVCLCNFHQPELSQIASYLLIAPQGLFLFKISTIKGIFQAAGESWEELDTRSKKFTQAKSNLLLETLQKSKELDAELASTGMDVPRIEPILYFANPGAHIDTEQPVVRILLVDALDRFLSGILRLPQVIDPDATEKLVDALCQRRAPLTSGVSKMNDRDVFSLHDPDENKKKKGPPSHKPILREPGVLKKMKFSRRQWIFLAIMIFVNIVILVGLVLVVLLLT